MDARRWPLGLPLSIVCAFCATSAFNQWTFLHMSRTPDGALPMPLGLALLVIAISQIGQGVLWLLGSGVLLGVARLVPRESPHLQWASVLRLAGLAHLPLLVWAVAGGIGLVHIGSSYAPPSEFDARLVARDAYFDAFETFAALKPWASTVGGAWLVWRLARLLELRSIRQVLYVAAPVAALVGGIWLVSFALAGGR